MEYGQPHARVHYDPMFKADFRPRKPIKNLASADKWGGGGGVIALRQPFPFVELTLKSQNKQSARLFSSRPDWVPHPFPCKGVLLLPALGPRGETH